VLSPPEQLTMAKSRKKSEVRKHTAMIRVDEHTRKRTMLAASMMEMSLAEFASKELLEIAERVISREAKKLAGGGK
jgi:hypothetical protein